MGSASSIASLRLNGAALLWSPFQFGGDLRSFAVVRPASGDPLRAPRVGFLKEDVRVLRTHLVERIPDPTRSLQSAPAGENNAKTGGQ